MAKYARKIGHIELIEKHYIFCGGKSTEIKYFNSIKKNINMKAINRNAVNIKVIYENASCDELVSKAYEEIKYNGITEGIVWCVYDKDDFSDKSFNNAAILVNKYSSDNISFHAIWSNQCFELWFLLHFEYYNSKNDRKAYFERLNSIFVERVGKNYEKNADNVYNIINQYGSEDNAIKFAKKLLDGKEHLKPSCIAPSTKVYEIIEAIKKYIN